MKNIIYLKNVLITESHTDNDSTTTSKYGWQQFMIIP